MSEEITAGLVTVRTSSTRLPEKCLLPFGDGNVLEHVIRRARMYGIDPVICTSIDSSDDRIEELARKEGVRCFRGSLRNKLMRWADCTSHFGIRHFHTVDADDPFFDGNEMKRSMALLAEQGLDMVCPTESSSAGGASVGYSLTADIVRRAATGLDDEADTEMMWYHVEKVPGLRKAVLSEAAGTSLKLRLTLDYPEDYWLLDTVRRVAGNLAPRQDINALFVRNPDLHRVNWFRNEEWQAAQKSKKTRFK